MDKEQYAKFYDILINAPKIELKEFEKDAKFFESCLPVEVIASRGVDTLRFGPMKPVGLIDKRTDEESWAVVQLRQDNSAKTLYNLVGFQTNLKWSSQKELIHSIPGLENANIIRYGVMHRNTFINSPKVLNAIKSELAGYGLSRGDRAKIDRSRRGPTSNINGRHPFANSGGGGSGFGPGGEIRGGTWSPTAPGALSMGSKRR